MSLNTAEAVRAPATITFIALCLMALGLTRVMGLVFVSTSVTRDSHHIFNPHAAGEERDSEKEADNENWYCHYNPCNGFDTAVTQPLE